MRISITAACCRSWCATVFRAKSWPRAAPSICAPTCCPTPAASRNREVVTLNRRNAARGRAEVTPIYTQADAIRRRSTRSGRSTTRPGSRSMPGVRARYWNAGHLLGSASIEIEFAGEGRRRAAVARARLRRHRSRRQAAATRSRSADGIRLCHFGIDLRRSAIGRRSPPQSRRERLAAEVRDAAAAQGRPADSGLRGRAHPGTDRRSRRPDGARRSADGADLSRFAAGHSRHRSVPAACVELWTPMSTSIGLLSSPHLRFTETVDESKAIAKLTGFHIIIAASGMCDAGRIRHHLKRWLWNSERDRSAGRLPGARHARALSRTTAPRPCASRARRSRSRPASAASTNIPATPTGPELARWIAARRPIHRGVFLVHGEEPALAGLSGPHRRADRSRGAGLPPDPRRHLRALDRGADADRRRRIAAGWRPRRWLRSIGTTTCRS